MRVQVQAYRDRYGSAFGTIGEAIVNVIMPLCPELARWHLGLSDQQPAKRVHPRDSRWLEGLAKGQLETTFSLMAKQHRFGAPQIQLETILTTRLDAAPSLNALARRMGNVQEKWLRASAPIFSARLPQQSPDKLILNIFATEWSLAVGYELRQRATLCAQEYTEGEKRGGKLNLETSRMRQAVKRWALAVLNNQWEEAMRLIGLIERRWMMLDHDEPDSDESSQRPRVLSDDEERCAAALHQAMKWVILGRWGLAFMALYHALFPEELSFEDDSLDGAPDVSSSPRDVESQHSDQPGDVEAEDQGSDQEQTPLVRHALAAFEAVEQLCGLCKAPYVPIPMQMGDSVGGRSWVLEDPLGEGLWQATDKSGMRGCVEEIWPLGDDLWSQQTQQRALTLSAMSYPHIAPIQDWGIDPEKGRWFLTYPFIYGESLAERIDQTPMSEAQARSFFLQAIAALKRGLKADLNHGQLRPENVVFYSEEHLVLTRWGVHRHKIEGWRSTTDLTPWRRCFCAPEMWASGEVTVHSDIYSLGMLMAFSLSPSSLKLDREWADLLRLSAKRDGQSDHWVEFSSIPTSFRAMIQKATDFDPEARYSSLSSLEKELKELKPLYNYRGEFGERDDLSLMEVVSLILSKPKARHSIWQGHLNAWKPWMEVDEIEQVVSAALQQQEEADRAAEEAARLLEEAEAEAQEDTEPEDKLNTPRSPRSPKRSMVKKPTLGTSESSSSTPPKRRRPPQINPYLRSSSVAEEPGTIHTITFEGIPLQLCYVPQGDFLMGAPRSPLTPRLERPQHVVSISRPILLGQTPITQGFYAALTGRNPSYFEDWEAPVEQISWREAAEFCNLLSKLDGLESVYHFKDEEVEIVEEEEPQSESENTLALLAAASRAKRDKRKGGKSRGKATSSSAEDAQIPSSSEEPTEGDDGAIDINDELDAESLPHNQESHDSSNLDSGHPDDVHPTLELSTEHEEDPSLEEKRRQILEEGEAELDEKFKRRHQLQRLKEAPKLRVWVRCDLNCGGYRLPTEAEWEYAARAGTSTIYPGSNQWRDVAWGASPSEEGTQPVANLKSNTWGFYDLGGNVAEWCTDDQRAYTRNCADPHHEAGSEWTLLDTRVIRGGGWRNPKFHARVSARGRCLADQRRNHIGFRVARPLLPINPFSVPNNASGGSHESD